MHCPLCLQDTDDRALVCSGCGRDIAVPQQLLDERDLLLARRSELKGKLEAVQLSIAQRRKK